MSVRSALNGYTILLMGAFFLGGAASRAHSAEIPGDLDPRTYQVGVAQIDITPAYPVRLSGFGFRRIESEGITHAIWAKALAIDDGKEGPAVLITTDNLGVPDELVNEVAARLRKRAGLKRNGIKRPL